MHKHSEALRWRLGGGREPIRRWSSLHNPREKRTPRVRTYSDSGGAQVPPPSPGRLPRVEALKAECLSPPPIYPRRRFSVWYAHILLNYIIISLTYQVKDFSTYLSMSLQDSSFTEDKTSILCCVIETYLSMESRIP
jgi:hypothetical protein